MDEVKPKIPQRVADINAEIARQGNKGFSVAPSAPTYVPPTTITSETLSNTEKPLSIPTPTVGTSNADLNALLATTVSQTKADALAEQTRLAQETARTEAETTKKNLYDTFLQKIGVQQSKGAVQEEFGVAGKTQKVTDLTNQLEALDKAELDEIRNLGSQPGTLAQKAQREQDIRSNYNMRKADIAILQSAANRDLATASALAEAKINTQLEPLNTRIEFLSMFYEDNKEQLSKADQNAFNVAIQDAQAERTQKANELKILSDTKLEVLKNIYANASPEVANQLARSVQMATTPEQVMMAAGQFAIKPVSGGTRGAGVTFGGTQYASDLDAIIGATLSTIPTKFGQQTFNEQIARTRNDADKISLVAAQVLKGQPAEFKNDFRNQAVGIGMIDKAIAELDRGTQTGAINASKQYAANFLGKDYDPALAKIEGYITSAIQPYRNSVTGAAWGDQEDAEYQQLFGSIKYSPAELRQRLLQTKELLKSKSAEGLNAFVNPLGTYDNQFETGDLTPQGSENPEDIFDSVISGESAESSSWIKNAWNSLFN